MKGKHLFSPVVPLTLILGLVTSARLGAGELDVETFARYVEASMAAYQVPGAAVAVVKDDELVLARGFGVRTLGEPEPVDAETLFAIASNTKAFTTALLAMLVTEGKLSWDDRVIDHLPDFRLFDPYATRELTVRDLVSHKSGLGQGSGDLLWLRSTYSREEIVRRIRYAKPAYSFRSRYAYSNVLFIVAGELVEAVSGTTWDDILAERIFRPLGMRTANSSLQKKTASGNWATPHVFMEGALRAIAAENVDNLGGAGAINASVAELSQWLRLQLGRGKLGDRTFYRESEAEEMWSPQTLLPVGRSRGPLAGLQARFAAYGLGWRLRDYRGRKLVYHAGGLAGMTSLTMLVPEERLGVVVLTNQETSLQTALTYWILDSFFEAPRTDWTAAHREAAELRWQRIEPRLKAIEAARVEGTVPSLRLEGYQHRYRDELYGDALVELREGRLHLRFAASPPFDARLDHWHYETFVARFEHHSIADAFVTFHLGTDAKVERITMRPYSPTADSSYHYRDLLFRPIADPP